MHYCIEPRVYHNTILHRVHTHTQPGESFPFHASYQVFFFLLFFLFFFFFSRFQIYQYRKCYFIHLFTLIARVASLPAGFFFFYTQRYSMYRCKRKRRLLLLSIAIQHDMQAQMVVAGEDVGRVIWWMTSRRICIFFD